MSRFVRVNNFLINVNHIIALEPCRRNPKLYYVMVRRGENLGMVPQLDTSSKRGRQILKDITGHPLQKPTMHAAGAAKA